MLNPRTQDTEVLLAAGGPRIPNETSLCGEITSLRRLDARHKPCAVPSWAHKNTGLIPERRDVPLSDLLQAALQKHRMGRRTTEELESPPQEVERQDRTEQRRDLSDLQICQSPDTKAADTG